MGPEQAYVRTNGTGLAAQIMNCPRASEFRGLDEYSSATFVKSCYNPCLHYEISADLGSGTLNGFPTQINCKILLAKSTLYRECLSAHVQAAE